MKNTNEYVNIMYLNCGERYGEINTLMEFIFHLETVTSRCNFRIDSFYSLNFFRIFDHFRLLFSYYSIFSHLRYFEILHCTSHTINSGNTRDGHDGN